jgi:magnesium transporter
MITVLVHLDGTTRQAETVDPAWLAPDARELFWLDLESPEEKDRLLLEGTLGVHELVVEDALSEIHHPKIERYDDLLYLILHGIVAGAAGKHGFVTQDVDFLIGRNYLVTVHHGPSRSIEAERSVCLRHSDVFADGPVGICHRLVDQIVDHYTPEVDRLEERLEKLERSVFGKNQRNPIRELLALKRDIAALRRVTLPQRDAIGRLARREFPEISDKLGYRFRDVFDHLVRLTDEALFLQDRVTGLIDAHLSNQSNRLNQVMKVLTVIATIFMPLTVLTSLYGMNVALPQLPGGNAAQFWWVMGIMLGVSAVMLWFFRRRRWL